MQTIWLLFSRSRLNCSFIAIRNFQHRNFPHLRLAFVLNFVLINVSCVDKRMRLLDASSMRELMGRSVRMLFEAESYLPIIGPRQCGIRFYDGIKVTSGLLNKAWYSALGGLFSSLLFNWTYAQQLVSPIYTERQCPE